MQAGMLCRIKMCGDDGEQRPALDAVFLLAAFFTLWGGIKGDDFDHCINGPAAFIYPSSIRVYVGEPAFYCRPDGVQMSDELSEERVGKYYAGCD